MRQLLIHVGHGKTGSSFLQNAFVLSHANLAKESIFYPMNISRVQAQRGVPTMGNARHAFDSIEQLEKTLRSVPKDMCSVLLSSEFAFGQIPNLIEEDRKNGFASFRELNQRFNIASWRLLLFIRDPMSFAVSAWLQHVKNNKETRPLEEFVLDWPTTYPLRTRGFIGICSELGFIELSIFNYSRIKKIIINIVGDWLGLEKNVLIAPTSECVNRSLTVGEAYLIAHLNRSNLQSKNQLGKLLVQALPNLQGDEFRLPLIVQEKFNALIRKEMELVAKLLPEGHEYRYEQFPHDDGEHDFHFTSKQLDIILDYLINDVVWPSRRNDADK